MLLSTMTIYRFILGYFLRIERFYYEYNLHFFNFYIKFLIDLFALCKGRRLKPRSFYRFKIDSKLCVFKKSSSSNTILLNKYYILFLYMTLIV